MRVELPRLVFEAAIERLYVLNESGKVKVDAHTHIRLETVPGGISLSAFNRTMRAEIRLAGAHHTGDHFVCGIPLEQLHDICATLPEIDQLTLDFAETSCTLLCGRVRFKTRVLLEDAFPRASEDDDDMRPVNLEFLLHAMGLVEHCADMTSHRFYAHGILINGKAFSATDGIRLARVPDSWLKPATPIALMMDTVTRLRKLFKGYREGSFALRERELLLTGGGIKAVALLASWKAPDTEGILPRSPSLQVRVPRKNLLPPLERSRIIASDKVPLAKLRISAEGVHLYTEEDGQIVEDLVTAAVPAGIHEKPPLRLNPMYLLEAVKSIEGDDILLEFRGPLDPLVVSDEGGSHVNIILPFREPA